MEEAENPIKSRHNYLFYSIVMKKYLFIILGAIILVGCGGKSEQEKALEAAIQTQQLSVLREFAVTYPDSIMETKVKADYIVALEALIKDSTYYEMATNGTSILMKYNAASAYVKEFPNGLHISEMQLVIAATQETAESLKAQIKELRNVFEQYKFVEKDNDGGTYEYDFQSPDEYGQGDVIIEASPIDSKITNVFGGYKLGRVTRKCTGKYYINDNLKVVLDVDETRTYGRQPGANQYDKEGMEELIYSLKYYYPTPPHRKSILTYSDEDFPQFSGKDNKNKTIRMSAVVK